MLWPSRRVASTVRSNQRKTYRQSIELPLAVSVDGLPAPVYGTLVNISETGCRIRSLILIDRGRNVEFELKREGRPPFQLHGPVVSRTNPPHGGGFEYGISFSAMPEPKREALVREILELQRREASSRADRPAALADESKVQSQRRRSVRTIYTLPVRFRYGGRTWATAEANDISTGGLRLISSDELTTGTEVEIRLTLPNSVLTVYPQATTRTEITPFGPRKIRIPDNRRPFEEITLHGRVLSRFAPSRGREVYGVQFTDIDGYHREEIARFTHAVQLQKLRNA